MFRLRTFIHVQEFHGVSIATVGLELRRGAVTGSRYHWIQLDLTWGFALNLHASYASSGLSKVAHDLSPQQEINRIQIRFIAPGQGTSHTSTLSHLLGHFLLPEHSEEGNIFDMNTAGTVWKSSPWISQLPILIGCLYQLHTGFDINGIYMIKSEDYRTQENPQKGSAVEGPPMHDLWEYSYVSPPSWKIRLYLWRSIIVWTQSDLWSTPLFYRTLTIYFFQG